MSIKTTLYHLQPTLFYVVLTLSICYLAVQLVWSHLTHALTLLMASYHMLCNIFALAGTIITMKHNQQYRNREDLLKNSSEKSSIAAVKVESNGKIPAASASRIVIEEESTLTDSKGQPMHSLPKTHNTFGWARIEILTILIVCVTLVSLSFSLLVEALQTLVHIDHQDTMHLPLHVMILGFVGLLINGFTYLLIGGYTLGHDKFRHMPVNAILKTEEQSISAGVTNDKEFATVAATVAGRQHFAEFIRDISSTVFVIVCSIIVMLFEDRQHLAKFIDPIASIISCMLVVALSYPYMKEACMILLQTIPLTIDINNFERTLVEKFPQIISYHDLHIWQLSSQTYIATIHIVFQNTRSYDTTIEGLKLHFQAHGIAHVTIQPEFKIDYEPKSSTECLIQCSQPECIDKVCCKDSLNDLHEIVNGNPKAINKSDIANSNASSALDLATLKSFAAINNAPNGGTNGEINLKTNSTTNSLKALTNTAVCDSVNGKTEKT